MSIRLAAMGSQTRMQHRPVPYLKTSGLEVQAATPLHVRSDDAARHTPEMQPVGSARPSGVAVPGYRAFRHPVPGEASLDCSARHTLGLPTSSALHPHQITTAQPPTISPQPASGPGEAAFRQGWTHLRGADAKAAARQFASACKSTQGSVAEDACFWAGASAKRAGTPAAARRSLRAFLRRFPNSPRSGEAAGLLGWLLYDHGELAQAERWFNKATTDPVPRVKASARRGLEAVARKRKLP